MKMPAARFPRHPATRIFPHPMNLRPIILAACAFTSLATAADLSLRCDSKSGEIVFE